MHERLDLIGEHFGRIEKTNLYADRAVDVTDDLPPNPNGGAVILMSSFNPVGNYLCINYFGRISILREPTINPSNPFIQRHAQKMEISPEHLCFLIASVGPTVG